MKSITSATSAIAITGAAAPSTMAELLANMTVKAPNIGDIVQGEVLATSRGGFIVGIGTKSDAFIYSTDCEPALKVGDIAKFLVGQRRDDDEEFTLTQVNVAAVEQRNAGWVKIESLLKTRATTHACVSTLTHNKTTGHFSGVEATIDGVLGFVPRRQLIVFGDPSQLLGTEIPVKVTKADREEGRHGEVILSHAQAVNEQQREFLTPLKRGDTLVGTVSRILPNEMGVLVSLGATTGLVHRSELADNRAARIADLVKIGQELTLTVLKIDLVKLTIHLSRKVAAFSSLKLGEVLPGVVVNNAPIGAFVTIHGCVDGLLHNSEFAVNDEVPETFSAGQAISVRIKGIDRNRQRISLTRVGC